MKSHFPLGTTSVSLLIGGFVAATATATPLCARETSAEACLYANPPANCKLIQTVNDECIYVHYEQMNGRESSTAYKATCSYDVYTTNSNGECVFSHAWTGESQCERASGKGCITSGGQG